MPKSRVYLLENNLINIINLITPPRQGEVEGGAIFGPIIMVSVSAYPHEANANGALVFIRAFVDPVTINTIMAACRLLLRTLMYSTTSRCSPTDLEL